VRDNDDSILFRDSFLDGANISRRMCELPLSLHNIKILISILEFLGKVGIFAVFFKLLLSVGQAGPTVTYLVEVFPLR
jgi:hypothetical protein